MVGLTDIIPPERLCTVDIGGSTYQSLLVGLGAFLGLAVEVADGLMDHAGNLVFTVRCHGRTETMRIPPKLVFPPSAYIAYLNAQIAETGGGLRLVACRDQKLEAVALAKVSEIAELRACIFLVDEDMKWPPRVLSAEEAALLAQIRNTPYDDAPRLALADLLVARGDVRGEMIRLQCDRDQLARERGDRLVAKNYAAWTSHVPPWGMAPVIERGFVSSMRVASRESFMEYAPQLFAMTPVPTATTDTLELTISADGRYTIEKEEIEDSDDSIFRVYDLGTFTKLLSHRHRALVKRFSIPLGQRALLLETLEETRQIPF